MNAAKAQLHALIDTLSEERANDVLSALASPGREDVELTEEDEAALDEADRQIEQGQVVGADEVARRLRALVR